MSTDLNQPTYLAIKVVSEEVSRAIACFRTQMCCFVLYFFGDLMLLFFGVLLFGSCNFVLYFLASFAVFFGKFCCIFLQKYLNKTFFKSNNCVLLSSETL